MYEKTAEGEVRPDSRKATLRATCPSRFEQDAIVYGWIGAVLLGADKAVPIGQVNFLERTPLMRARSEKDEDSVAAEEVGRIDNILIIPGSQPPRWCPVEVQAVYFSGAKMELEFASYRSQFSPDIVFPVGRRRPDYRSSGPKRLMPQLLVKVPTLRRWGKKMAVVVDEDFFAELGRMEPVADISNCDVAWFVVAFEEEEASFVLKKREIFLTTLENSQNGLVAARPVTKDEFEKRIMTKLKTV
jgi:hypothetical protein